MCRLAGIQKKCKKIEEKELRKIYKFMLKIRWCSTSIYIWAIGQNVGQLEHICLLYLCVLLSSLVSISAFWSLLDTSK